MFLSNNWKWLRFFLRWSPMTRIVLRSYIKMHNIGGFDCLCSFGLMLIKMKVYPSCDIDVIWGGMWEKWTACTNTTLMTMMICMGRVRLMTKLNQNVNLSVRHLMCFYHRIVHDGHRKHINREITFFTNVHTADMHVPTGHENVFDGKVSNLMFYCCFVSFMH